MKPFEYLEPASLEEACSLLSEHQEEAKIIAGGQSLLPLLKARLIAPKYLINIKGLPNMEYITPTENGIKIGALTVHRALELSPLINERFPILSEMEKVVGTVQIRNWGTIGGDLCHADPSGDPAPALIALGAKVKAVSQKGEREIDLDDFFVDYLQTVLQPDEILVEVEVPSPKPHTGGAYIKESVRVGDSPIVSAAVVVTLDKDVIQSARIVLGALGTTPVRAKKAEEVMVGRQIKETLEKVGEIAASEAKPETDIVGLAEYKRELVKVITRQAAQQAIMRARTR